MPRLLSLPIQAPLWTVLVCIFTAPVTQSSKGLHMLHFQTISKDRAADVVQQIFISSFQNTQIRLEMPMAHVINYLVLDESNNRSSKLAFNQDLGVESSAREFITHSAALLVSDGTTPIWLHANKMEQGTTAAYLALPITQHSTEFYIPSYTAPGSTSTTAAFHSGFAVAGLQDGTCLEVYAVRGSTYRRIGLYHLDANDVFTAQESKADFDYTGYYVNSTRPISVWSGHECAYVSKTVRYCDAISEQAPPVIEWGWDHIIGPIAGRTNVDAGYEYRVIAQENDTTVTFTSSAGGVYTGSANINRGQDFYSGATSGSLDTVWLRCDKKCLVSQYNPGKTKAPGETVKTDPYMVIVTPLDHYDKNIRFVTMEHYDYTKPAKSIDWITIVAKTASRDGIRLDSQPLTGGTWREVTGKTDYSYYYTRVTVAGFHTLTHTDPTPTQEYMAWVYGHGQADNTAYGYMAAYKITDDPVTGSDLYDVVEPTTKAPVITAAPWVLGNWTGDFTSDDLPMYGIRFQKKFYVTDRKKKVIEKVCSDGYMDFFQKKRLPAMATHITANINTLCPGLIGSEVQVTGGKNFYTVYTHGQVDFFIFVIGSPTTTFRKVEDCIDNLKEFVNVAQNWPAVASKIKDEDPPSPNNPTTKSNFLSRDGKAMDECEKFEFWYESEQSTDMFGEVARGWICNGKDPEDILKIIDGATGLVSMSFIQICALALVTYSLLNTYHL